MYNNATVFNFTTANSTAYIIRLSIALAWTELNVQNYSPAVCAYSQNEAFMASLMGNGGTCIPWKCCKVFCAFSVTVKRSVDQLFMHHFHNFLEGRSGSFSILACVLRATTKKRSSAFLEEKVHPTENPGYSYEFAHPWKRSCGRPWNGNIQSIATMVDKAGGPAPTSLKGIMRNMYVPGSRLSASYWHRRREVGLTVSRYCQCSLSLRFISTEYVSTGTRMLHMGPSHSTCSALADGRRYRLTLDGRAGGPTTPVAALVRQSAVSSLNYSI